MGRDKPTRVDGTPRGLGLYRRQGREGFFFVKNLSHIAKEFPEAFERNGQINEWIKRADGSIVDNVKEAKAYCYRRIGDIEQRKVILRSATVRYSSTDLEGIAQAVSSTWIKKWQRGKNLQQLDISRWKGYIQTIRRINEDSRLARFQCFLNVEIDGHVESLDDEEKKLLRIIFDHGYRPDADQVKIIMMRFASLLVEYLEEACKQKNDGEIRIPKPHLPHKSHNWNALVNAKKSDGVANSTIKGLTVAIKRLEKWATECYGVKLPGSIDEEMALEYRAFLTNESSLKLSSALKELKFISSAFSSGTKRKIIERNPFLGLPKDRGSSIMNSLATKKTIDNNDVISAEAGREINRKMLSNKWGEKDPSYDVFILQAMTGARIQEIAGLRGCDFVKRQVSGKEYFCIRITSWEQRGHGALQARGGLKTTASERFVPLPACGHVIWQRYADINNVDAAFPNERPKTAQQCWGDRLKRRMRGKYKAFKTKSWRETVSNNATNAGLSYRAVEMVTGKTGSSTVVQYTSDNLAVMQKVVEVNAESLQIEKWLEASRQQAEKKKVVQNA